MPMIETAEIVAGGTESAAREQDEYALESQRRTAAAQKAGRLDAEIVPLTPLMQVENKETKEISKRTVTLESDEGNRPETTLEGLAALKPVPAMTNSSPPAMPASFPMAPAPAC